MNILREGKVSEVMDHCQDCGLCCKRLLVEITHTDVVREPKLLEHAQPLRHLDWVGKWDRPYRLCLRNCPMLGPDNRCTVYASRPDVCVQFEVGGSKCNELRAEAGMTKIESEL